MSSLGDRLIPLLAALLIRIIYATMRIRHVGYGPAEELRKQGTRYILAFWHAHLLLMVFAKYEPPIVTMISRHRDGELIARTVSYFGARSTRGSTTRGGATALRGLIAAARAGATLAITPDGPRGPRHVAQTGTVHAAQATGLPIVPVAFISHPKIRFRSWDRFEVPWLFSRGVFLYGEPIAVPRKMNKQDIENYRLEIESELRRLTEKGEADFEALWKMGEN